MMILNFFPSAALSASGSKGIISALWAPPKFDYKDNKFLETRFKKMIFFVGIFYLLDGLQV